MRFTYADNVAARQTSRPSLVRRGLTLVLIGLGCVAVFELVTFIQDYWRALNG
jgi:hypothetical protein